MASQTASMADELNALIGCSICFEDCIDPRALPCMHTFCLMCLKNLARPNCPGERVHCPLCRKKFSIPRDGVCGLPKNPIVSRIIEISNISRTDYDKEGAERERLRKNAEKISTMISDGERDAKLRRKATVNFITRNKQEKERILKDIENLHSLLADMDSRRFRNLEVLGEETERMDQHLATLESYKDYCLCLAEKGSASAVSSEVLELDKRLQVLGEVHESRTERELSVRQKLLENKEIDKGSRPNSSVASVRDATFIDVERLETDNDNSLSRSPVQYTESSNERRDSPDFHSGSSLSRRRRHSAELSDGDTEGSDRKRATFTDGERRESSRQSQVSDDYSSTPVSLYSSRLVSDFEQSDTDECSLEAASFNSWFTLDDDNSTSDSNVSVG